MMQAKQSDPTQPNSKPWGLSIPKFDTKANSIENIPDNTFNPAVILSRVEDTKGGGDTRGGHRRAIRVIRAIRGMHREGGEDAVNLMRYMLAIHDETPRGFELLIDVLSKAGSTKPIKRTYVTRGNRKAKGVARQNIWDKDRRACNRIDKLFKGHGSALRQARGSFQRKAN